MNAARGIALAVALLLAAPATIGSSGALLADNIARGSDAVRLLGLDGGPLQVPLPGQTALKERLLREQDLGVGVNSKRLVYTCGGLARRGNATAGIEKSIARPGREALQLLQANLADPLASAVPKSASGVPKLHRRVRPHHHAHNRMLPPNAPERMQPPPALSHPCQSSATAVPRIAAAPGPRARSSSTSMAMSPAARPGIRTRSPLPTLRRRTSRPATTVTATQTASTPRSWRTSYPSGGPLPRTTRRLMST
jgi:hypothetical protein